MIHKHDIRQDLPFWSNVLRVKEGQRESDWEERKRQLRRAQGKNQTLKRVPELPRVMIRDVNNPKSLKGRMFEQFVNHRLMRGCTPWFVVKFIDLRFVDDPTWWPIFTADTRIISKAWIRRFGGDPCIFKTKFMHQGKLDARLFSLFIPRDEEPCVYWFRRCQASFWLADHWDDNREFWLDGFELRAVRMYHYFSDGTHRYGPWQSVKSRMQRLLHKQAEEDLD
jgi:hypothetical protein